jgi:lipopolysaccharide transport system ATP-binding protein
MKALVAENISKVYRKGAIGSGSLAKEIEFGIKRYFRGKSFQNSQLENSNFHKSLDQINFEIEEGDRVGIIGKNGAGKSTLLKIISRITTPTEGRIKGFGRVASLLEVGTGFHPELTGLENIYLNGSIIGMKNAEIKANLDSIISFSGVDSYIHTPVKRYSSGMYVRLAFSIAAHLQSEILIVDEVLAVGDVEFQKMCIDKMKELSHSNGKTILFVSHNLNSVATLCNNSMLLESGKLLKIGKSEDVLNTYIQRNNFSKPLGERTDKKGNQKIKLIRYNWYSEKEKMVISGKETFLELSLYSSLNQITNVEISIAIDHQEGFRISILNNTLISQNCPVKQGENTITISISNLPLPMGIYPCTFYLSSNGEIFEWIKDAFNLEVLGESYFPNGNSLPKKQGFVYLPFSIKSN